MSTAATQSKPTLYAKAGADGKTIGDCPFTHKARLALAYKQVDYDIEIIDLGAKPEWFLKINDEGTVPALVAGERLITSSDGIVAYADEVGTGDKLVQEGEGPEEIGKVFGAFMGLMKGKAEDSTSLETKLIDALTGVDRVLENSGGPYLLGSQFSALDCGLAPVLYAIRVAAKHFKNFEIPEELTAVQRYMSAVSETDLWKKTSYPEETVIWGWSKLFK